MRKIVKREFISSSAFIFVDNLAISISGWFFWFVVSKFATAGDIGISTYLFTLSAFLSGVIMLGLEFSLVKVPEKPQEVNDSSEYHLRKLSFGTIFVIEIVANLGLIPLIMVYLKEVYPSFNDGILMCTVLIFVFTTISTISRYALMGIMATKQILIIDVVAIFVRFIVAVLLLENRQGVFAILLATLIQTIVLSVIPTMIFIGRIGFGFSTNMLRSILKEGLSNFPGKISKIMIAPISVILLGALKVDPANMGLFFISLIITVVAATFGTSLSTMSLSSAHKNKDLMFYSLRFGMSFTAPLVPVLVVFPASVLGLINENFVVGSEVLTILGFSVVPSVLVFNVITRLNSAMDNKRLIQIGVIELGIFLFLFVVLVPNSGTYGAANSILVAYLVSAGVAFRWIESREQIFIAKSIISVGAGIIISLILKQYLAVEFTVVLSIAVTVLVSHLSGALKLREIKDLALMAIRK